MTMRKALCVLLIAALLPSAGTAAEDARPPADWQLAGTLGLLQFIVVPEASARDQAYYERIIAEVCADQTASCFLRFFTNGTGAALTFPLPDAVIAEPTVMFQRSAKHLREQFQWSCRLQISGSAGMPAHHFDQIRSRPDVTLRLRSCASRLFSLICRRRSFTESALRSASS
jgi:hypothetical protein